MAIPNLGKQIKVEIGKPFFYTNGHNNALVWNALIGRPEEHIQQTKTIREGLLWRKGGGGGASSFVPTAVRRYCAVVEPESCASDRKPSRFLCTYISRLEARARWRYKITYCTLPTRAVPEIRKASRRHNIGFPIRGMASLVTARRGRAALAGGDTNVKMPTV